jgi:dihydropyrimidine dehydrogenase (NAD+) subunit PreT
MTRPAEDRAEAQFSDFKHAYSRGQALTEANRCLYCEDAPCIAKCPTAIDIPEFIRKISTDNVKGSARTIFTSNILGMSCARVCPVEVLCVGDCVYNGMDAPPIQIGKLQRYATDLAFEKGWRFFEAGPDSGKSVGLIGGGPASLACAHELRTQGHAVTIYEKRGYIGGLNTTGVAPYKMRADKSVEEAEWVLGIGGIDVQLQVEIGKDLSLAALEDRHDAVFFGAGLGPDRMLDVKGKDVAGVMGAVDWIECMKLGQIHTRGITHAVVLGGGNTAVDAVRELVGLGIPCVTMVYRGVEEKMSGYQHEWSEAKREGARASWRAQPVGFESAKGVVTGVTCEVLDENKKPTGRHYVEPAELVLLAIGQSKIGDMLAGLDGIDIEWGRVVTDDDGATGRPGWFAGGDAANGGKEVVNAAAEGMRAARAIGEYLGGDRG